MGSIVTFITITNWINKSLVMWCNFLAVKAHPTRDQTISSVHVKLFQCPKCASNPVMYLEYCAGEQLFYSSFLCVLKDAFCTATLLLNLLFSHVRCIVGESVTCGGGDEMCLNASLNSVEFSENPFYLLLQHRWVLKHNFVSRKLFFWKLQLRSCALVCTGFCGQSHWLLMSSVWQPGKQ